MPKTLWILRHGQTDYNKNHIIQGSGVDSSLNKEGRSQAKKFYEKYKNVNFDLFVTSELVRTEQTIKSFLSSQVRLWRTPLINEIGWGIHEGKAYSKEMKSNYTALINSWNMDQLDARLEGGESAQELQSRLTQFKDELLKYEFDNTLICTHGRAIRCLLTVLMDEHPREMEKYAHANTGLFKLDYDGGRFHFKLNNDTSHLEE